MYIELGSMTAKDSTDLVLDHRTGDHIGFPQICGSFGTGAIHGSLPGIYRIARSYAWKGAGGLSLFGIDSQVCPLILWDICEDSSRCDWLPQYSSNSHVTACASILLMPAAIPTWSYEGAVDRNAAIVTLRGTLDPGCA